MAILLTVIQGNLLEIWRMRVQLLPGLIFAGSDIKAKIRPGIEASPNHALFSYHYLLDTSHGTQVCNISTT